MSVIELPNYQVLEKVGHGGTSTVYRAIQRSLNRAVALKVMSAGLAHDETFSTRFLKEGKTIARLSHANIITIYDIGVVNDWHYMAMEYMGAGSLRERIGKALDLDQIFDILRCVADALAYAHSQGVVHRDVKPANILFREQNTLALSDFGIAKVLDGNTMLTAVGTPSGTPLYMSPEQARGSSVDGRCDQYSLGIVLYECLMGKPPYQSDNPISIGLMHIQQPIPQLSSEYAVFQPLLDRMLAKDPADRFVYDEHLLKAIDDLEYEVLGDYAGPPPLPPSKKSASTAAVTGATSLLAVALGIGVYFGFHNLFTEPSSSFTLEHDREVSGQNQTSRGTTPLPPLPEAEPPADEPAIAEPPESELPIHEPPIDWQIEIGRWGYAEFVPEADPDEVTNGETLSWQQAVAEAVAVFMPPDNDTYQRQNYVQLQDETREARVQSLLADARRHIEELRLTIPMDNSALASLRAARRLDPDNPAINAGFREIVSRYKELARTRLARGELEDSMERIRRGLMVAPSDTELLALRSEVNEKIAQRLRVEQTQTREEETQRPARPRNGFDGGWSDR